jgi:hypothetical protein
MQNRTACLTARLSCARRSFAGIHLTLNFRLSSQQPKTIPPRGSPQHYFSLAEPVRTWVNRGLAKFRSRRVTVEPRPYCGSRSTMRFRNGLRGPLNLVHSQWIQTSPMPTAGPSETDARKAGGTTRGPSSAVRPRPCIVCRGQDEGEYERIVKPRTKSEQEHRRASRLSSGGRLELIS